MAVTATGTGPEVRLPEHRPGTRDVAEARKPDRPVYFPETRGYGRVPRVRPSAACPSGRGIEGPGVVEEPESTTVLPPGTTAEVDPWANLIVSVA